VENSNVSHYRTVNSVVGHNLDVLRNVIHNYDFCCILCVIKSIILLCKFTLILAVWVAFLWVYNTDIPSRWKLKIVEMHPKIWEDLAQSHVHFYSSCDSMVGAFANRSDTLTLKSLALSFTEISPKIRINQNRKPLILEKLTFTIEFAVPMLPI